MPSQITAFQTNPNSITNHFQLYSLFYIGGLYRKTNQYNRSIDYYQHAARIAKERSLTKEYGSLCDRLGQVNQDNKTYGQAELNYVEALKTFVPPDVALKIFAPKGKQIDVLSMSLKEIKKWWKLPVDASMIIVENSEQFVLAAGVLYNLASMYCEIGKLKQAESVLKRCIVSSKLSGGTSREQEKKMLVLLDMLIQERM